MHCQGGKGRTGTFCAALLLWTGFCATADEALELYARRRSDPQLGRRRRLHGVDSPGQRRYLRYLERALYGSGLDPPVPPTTRRTLLTAVTLVAPPMRRGAGGAPARVSLVVESLGTVQYDQAKRHGALPLPDPAELSGLGLVKDGEGALAAHELRFELGDGVLVAGDVTVRFYLFEDGGPVPPAGAELGPGARTARYGSSTGRQLCFSSVHTSFHGDETIVLRRDEVSGGSRGG